MKLIIQNSKPKPKLKLKIKNLEKVLSLASSAAK